MRTQQCVQTLQSTSRLQIKKFVNIDSMYFIGMEKRIIMFRFEEIMSVNSNGITISSNYPIGIEFNTDLNEAYICTKHDIR